MGLTGRPPGVRGAALLLKPRGGNPCPFLPAVRTTCAPPPSPEGWLCSRHSDPPVSVPSTLRACDYTGAAWKTQDNLHIFRSADLQPPSHLLRCSLLRESGQSHSCRDARVSFGGHGSTDPGNSREASSWAWAPDSAGHKTGEHTSRAPSFLRTKFPDRLGGEASPRGTSRRVADAQEFRHR